MIIKGLHLDVYKNRGSDCTLGGISSMCNEVIAVGATLRGPIDVDLERPPANAVCIIKRTMNGRDIYHAEPLDGCNAAKFLGKTGGRWYMFGGNYVATSDSRLSEACGGLYGAVKLHDRCEN